MPQATWENTWPRRSQSNPKKTPYINRRARAREGCRPKIHSMNYRKLRRMALDSNAFGRLLAVARLPELKIIKTAGFIVSCIL
jgi:hypothetical protein